MTEAPEVEVRLKLKPKTYLKLWDMARIRGVDVEDFLKAVLDAAASTEESIDYRKLFTLMEQDVREAEKYQSRFCPVCGRLKFEVALAEIVEEVRRRGQDQR